MRPYDERLCWCEEERGLPIHSNDDWYLMWQDFTSTCGMGGCTQQFVGSCLDEDGLLPS